MNKTEIRRDEIGLRQRATTLYMLYIFFQVVKRNKKRGKGERERGGERKREIIRLYEIKTNSNVKSEMGFSNRVWKIIP